MKKSELKQIIRECITEIYQEIPWTVMVGNIRSPEVENSLIQQLKLVDPTLEIEDKKNRLPGQPIAVKVKSDDKTIVLAMRKLLGRAYTFYLNSKDRTIQIR